MAKIKSTLDLVMERTKNLTITKEEKEELHRKEWSEKARAWVQKIIDQKMSMSEFKSALNSGMAAYPDVKGILKDELVGRIDPDEDNAAVFRALEEVMGADAGPYRDSIRAYHDRLNFLRSEHLERLKSELILRGISGTAVLPNLNHDEVWEAATKKGRKEFQLRLKGIRGI